jgi:hypothetical protein
MNERIVNLKIKEAFEKLKQLIILKSYSILNEESPSILTIKQGSIWGISPRTAKKIVTFNLQPVKSGTSIKYSSKFAPKWKNLTIAGDLLSSFLILLSLWITIDLELSLLNRAPSFWSWIATYANIITFSALQSFSFLAKLLFFFLIVILLVESVIVIYSYLNVNLIAEETLNQFG